MNALIKKAILACALTSFALSSANAADYLSTNGEIVAIHDIVDSSGSLNYTPTLGAFDLKNSSLGNSSGGRFSVFTNGARGQINLDNSSLYVYDILGDSFTVYMQNNSYLHTDNGITMPDGSGGITIRNSRIKASTITTEDLSLMDGSYGEFTAVSTRLVHIENSTWVATGVSTLEFLELGGTLEMRMSSAMDAIYVSNKILVSNSYPSYINFTFTEDFIESILFGDGYFDLIRANTIVGTMIAPPDTPSYSVANSNDTYSWTVSHISGGWRISDINLIAIPEPSTYAAIFGFIALVVVAYKRRK